MTAQPYGNTSSFKNFALSSSKKMKSFGKAEQLRFITHGILNLKAVVGKFDKNSYKSLNGS